MVDLPSLLPIVPKQDFTKQARCAGKEASSVGEGRGVNDLVDVALGVAEEDTVSQTGGG